MVLGPLLGENAGSDSGAGDVWVVEGTPIELVCNQERFAFQEEKQRVVRTLITFGRYLIISGRFFCELSLQADRDPGGANFYIFVPSLGLPKTTARVGTSSSTAEKTAVRRDGGR